MTTQRDLRLDTDPEHVSSMGTIRRMVVAFTNKVLWQLTGARMPGGVETRQAEVFSGIGFFARPPSSGKPEVVTANLGSDASATVVVATRDEATRAKSAGQLAEDETAAFTSKAIAHIKADGTIELRGVPQLSPPEPMIKGTTYRTAEDAMVTAVATMSTAVAALATALVALHGGLAPYPDTLPGTPVLVSGAAAATAAANAAAAIAAFKTAAASYLARVGKVE